MAMTAAEALRDYETDGVPSSGPHQTKKADLRNVIGGIEILINAGGIGSATWKSTKALLTADLLHAAGSVAIVYSDTASVNNGLYVKAGASGFGSWTQFTTFLPGYQFVTATNDGSGTTNAYSMDTSPRLPAGDGVALIEFVVPATNTSTTVTVTFDTDAPLTIKTASGNAPSIGGLIAGMPVSGVKIGSNFYMRSDQASAAIQTAAEAAVVAAEGFRDQAEAYADFARNNWAMAASGIGIGAESDIPLLLDPGSVNNMMVVLGGVLQMVSQGAYSLVYVGADAFVRMTVPIGVPYEVKAGNAVTVGTPSDGTITTPKLAADAVTAAKISAADAVAIRTKIGVDAAGLAIVASRMPIGSIVDSASNSYAANANLSTVIPRDDTPPLVAEGTQILSVVITPKSTTNKLRCRFRGQAAKSVIGSIISAIFASGTGISGTAGEARAVDMQTAGTVDYTVSIGCEVEFVPGTTNAVTVTVRVGPDATGGNVRLNGTTAGRFLGGVSAATLVVEEIKA